MPSSRVASLYLLAHRRHLLTSCSERWLQLYVSSFNSRTFDRGLTHLRLHVPDFLIVLRSDYVSMFSNTCTTWHLSKCADQFFQSLKYVVICGQLAVVNWTYLTGRAWQPSEDVRSATQDRKRGTHLRTDSAISAQKLSYLKTFLFARY